MADILFISNDVSHFASAKTYNGTHTFDSDRVPYSIQLSNFQTVFSPTFTPTTTDTSWLHFRAYWDSSDYNRDDSIAIGFTKDNVKLFELKKLDSSNQDLELFLFEGSSVFKKTIPVSVAFGLINTFDIKYTSTSQDKSLALYMNKGLVGTLSTNTNAENTGQMSYFSLSTGFTKNLDSPCYFSEILVASQDTRNARVDLVKPISAGSFEDWKGQLTTLADDDPTSGVFTTDPNKRHSLVMSQYKGAPNISNVVTVSSTTRGINSPTKLKHFTRISGVTYDSDPKDVDFTEKYHITDYQVNPGTGVPWKSSDLTNVEFGFMSEE